MITPNKPLLALSFVLWGAGFVAGAVLWGAYASILIDWLGLFFGVVVAVLFFPGTVVCPGIIWLVEGTFPTFYVLVELVGIVCIALAAKLASR